MWLPFLLELFSPRVFSQLGVGAGCGVVWSLFG